MYGRKRTFVAQCKLAFLWCIILILWAVVDERGLEERLDFYAIVKLIDFWRGNVLFWTWTLV